MSATYWRLVVNMLVVTLVVMACNDDTSSSPTGPQDSSGQPAADDDAEPASSVDDEASVFFAELNQAMGDVLPMLIFGGGELQGSGGGRVLVEGTTMTFEEYSPDGVTIMTGVIVIDAMATPWSINGSLTLNGGNEGEVIVAMTLDPLADPPTVGGTVTIDGTEYDVTEFSVESTEG